MDTVVLREIFGSDVAIFIYGIFAGYFIVPINLILTGVAINV
ncbi:hypothetical protein [Campylobacter mucosalis]|nr:hypothetical protein [Campylobacter mucosalis]